MLQMLFQNKRTKAEVCDQETGVNAFWFAAYYGHGGAVSFLANKGLNIFVKHRQSNSNALHIAIQRKHYDIALQLIKSNFPVNEVNNGGMSALLLVAKDKSKDAFKVAT